MKDLITTKEELYEKFKGQSEESIKALVQKTMLGVYSEKDKLVDAAMKWQQLDKFYEYVKEVNCYLNHPENGCPAGMNLDDHKELVEFLENNH